MSDLIDILVPADLEGTESIIACWLKSAGDAVREHEPLVEINTDKATVEVAAPASGILREILKTANEPVEPEMLLGQIEPGEHQTRARPSATSASPERNPATSLDRKTVSSTGESEYRLSPAVQRLIERHGIDPARLSGSGRAGRITREDVEAYLAAETDPSSQRSAAKLTIPDTSDLPSNFQTHSIMRRKIADHMVHSALHTAPHVTAVFSLDMSSVIAHRDASKEKFASKAVKLTYISYFVYAAVEALKVVPEVNSRWRDDGLEIFTDYNIGVGTALEDKGLVVPVIHKAQELSFFDLAQRMHQLTHKAREGSLSPTEMKDGTFTISNHGVSGSLLAAPIIINQPQSAILGIGKLEKRVVAIERDGKDVMEIRPMCYATLTIDHRVLDAWHTNTFMSKFVEVLEEFKPVA